MHIENLKSKFAEAFTGEVHMTSNVIRYYRFTVPKQESSGGQCEPCTPETLCKEYPPITLKNISMFVIDQFSESSEYTIAKAPSQVVPVPPYNRIFIEGNGKPETLMGVKLDVNITLADGNSGKASLIPLIFKSDKTGYFKLTTEINEAVLAYGYGPMLAYQCGMFPSSPNTLNPPTKVVTTISIEYIVECKPTLLISNTASLSQERR